MRMLYLKTVDECLKYIKNWMVHDVGICHRKNNHANIATINLLCCYSEFLGSLITGKGEGNSRKNFYAFCRTYLGKLNPNYDNFKCKLYEDFRCGLVHEFIMKKGTGIVRDNDSTHFVIDQGILVVNITTFYEDFKKAISMLRNDALKKQAVKDACSKRLKDMGVLN